MSSINELNTNRFTYTYTSVVCVRRKLSELIYNLSVTNKYVDVNVRAQTIINL